MTTPATLTNIVVLGGGYAGILAALRLHHRTRGMAVKLILINNAPDFINRIRLHEVAAGKNRPVYSIKHLLRGTRVHFQQGTVTSIDTTKRHIQIKTPDGTAQIHYDRLIYALGSSPDRSQVPGAQDYTYTLDPQSAQLLAERLPTARHLLLVGGGLTAIEGATEIAEKYPNLHVELLTAGRFGEQLSAKGARYLRETFAKLHITIHEQVRVAHVEPDRVIDDSGNEYPFEMCVWLAGFKVSPLARTTGLAVNDQGQLLVDEHLQSISHPEIYGAGDATTIYNLRMACATAMPMAAYAADAITAELKQQPREAFRFGFAARCISLGRRRGLVQVVMSDDTPREQVFTGRAAAIFKETIVRYVGLSLRLERLMPVYMWPKPQKVQSPAVASQLATR